MVLRLVRGPMAAGIDRRVIGEVEEDTYKHIS
jgi:hypothetical protein